MTKNICKYCSNYLCDVRHRVENFENYSFSQRDKEYYKNELAKELADYAVEIDVNGSVKVIACEREEKRV